MKKKERIQTIKYVGGKKYEKTYSCGSKHKGIRASTSTYDLVHNKKKQ